MIYSKANISTFNLKVKDILNGLSHVKEEKKRCKMIYSKANISTFNLKVKDIFNELSHVKEKKKM